MTITCTLEELHRITKENPELTIVEYIAMLQARRITEESEEMTLEDVKDFAQMERDYQDLVYEMTHQ